MKNLTTLSIAFTILILMSFKSRKSKVLHGDCVVCKKLEVGEIFEYSDIKAKNVSGSYKRSSYDQTSYNIEFDTTGTVQLDNVNGAKDIHQNEMNFILCKGKIKMTETGAEISASSGFNKIYVIRVDDPEEIDSFDSDINIHFNTITTSNTDCPLILSKCGSTNLVAIPEGVKCKEVWKESHPKKTVGLFQNLTIRDSLNRHKVYKQGDFVIVGGNRLIIK